MLGVRRVYPLLYALLIRSLHTPELTRGGTWFSGAFTVVNTMHSHFIMLHQSPSFSVSAAEFYMYFPCQSSGSSARVPQSRETPSLQSMPEWMLCHSADDKMHGYDACGRSSNLHTMLRICLSVCANKSSDDRNGVARHMHYRHQCSKSSQFNYSFYKYLSL